MCVSGNFGLQITPNLVIEEKKSFETDVIKKQGLAHKIEENILNKWNSK